MQTPLLVVVIRRGEFADSSSYARALREAFVGQRWGDVTTVPRELLQAGEFREFYSDGDTIPVPQQLWRSADRLLIVVLDARPRTPLSEHLNDTEIELSSMVDLTASTIVVNVLLSEPSKATDPESGSGQIVRLGLGDLEERDLQLPFLTLYALHNALRLFAPAQPNGSAGKPARLFFSHAKRDGVPLTTAVHGWMDRLKGFESFYDTKNLDLDGDLDVQLQDAIASGTVVVFRTDIFDQRYWCQKEVLWAERYGRPVITVDARWHIEHSASVISFDSTPVVRIPDGNLVRIFATALVEALRISLFVARASKHESGLSDGRIVAIPRYPSLVSMHAACEHLAETQAQRKFIVYPNPALPSVMSDAAQAIALGLEPSCRVLSLDEFRLCT